MLEACPNVHKHKCLDDDATENMKPHAFATSREYVTVQRFTGLKCAAVCYFQGKIFNPTNLFNRVAPSVKLMIKLSNLVLITALCNNLEHLCLTW